MSPISLTIDGRPIKAAAGATVLDAARSVGIYIPTLCAHEDLPPYGACRLCVVEIDGVRGYPTSCTTPVAHGMIVRTDTPALQELRDATLELMLSGHPNSCLVCDHRADCEKYRPRPTKAGRSTRCGACSNRDGCSIREMSILRNPRKLNLPTIYSTCNVDRDDPFIERDHNLCVLCGRCWRICEQLHGKPAISIMNRGPQARIGTAFNRSWLDSGCTFCGACVDICPTGTLTDRYSRWYDISQRELTTTCSLCTEGCAIKASLSGGKIVATQMTAMRRESRVCAAGRFAYAQVLNDPRRLTQPTIREDGELVPVEWEEAIATVAARLGEYRGAGFTAIVGPGATRENAFMYQRLTRTILNGNVIALADDGDDCDVPNTARAVLTNGDYLDPDKLRDFEYVVALDFLPSPITERADAVLPVAVLAEMEGTFVGADGKIRRVSKIVNPPGNARAEWVILSDLADALGQTVPCQDSDEETHRLVAATASPITLRRMPRDNAREIPSSFRGHLLADSVPALKSLGLASSNSEERPGAGRFTVLEKCEVVPNFHRLVIEAPAVAKFAKPGQFAIVMAHEVSERIPFTLCDWDAVKGTITLIIEDVGRSSHEIAGLSAGDRLAHVSGPLGLPMEIKRYGRVALGGGCYGVGSIYPLARALRAAGNRVICVIEACTSHSLYMERELREVCDELIPATKDGSRGLKGGVQDVFVTLAKRKEQAIDLFVAIGCAFMMRMTVEKTRETKIPLLVALNPIMVDGTGMCGACRLSVNNETKFACVDGPMFDGHVVDWDELFARRGAYMRAEVEAMPQNGSHHALNVLQHG